MTPLRLQLSTRRRTRQFGGVLAGLVRQGDLIYLQGPLGAGKTFFVRGLLRALGLSEQWPVTSPTFALVHEHEARLPVRHVDLYRIGEGQSIEALGLHADAEGFLTLVEWGEGFEEVLGRRGLRIALSRREDTPGRQADVEALDERGEEILRALRADSKLQTFD